MQENTEQVNVPEMTAQQKKFSSASFSTYKQLCFGSGSLLGFFLFELYQLFFMNLPALFGFALRRVFFPPFLGSCGGGLAFGRGVTVRSPGSIRLGKKVMVDDLVTLDCREPGSISCGSYVSIGRSTILAAKEAEIVLHDGVNVGSSCRIASQSRVEIGASTLIAAYSYIGPGNHLPSENGSFISGQMENRGGVKIGSNVWVGARATILDGVTIGDGAVVGAHSLVRENVPAGAVVAGAPAKIISKDD